MTRRVPGGSRCTHDDLAPENAFVGAVVDAVVDAVIGTVVMQWRTQSSLPPLLQSSRSRRSILSTMPDKPAAEVVIDDALVRRLVASSGVAVPQAPVTHVADGWDCSVWRLGDDLAVRLPRRAAAASLLRNEQCWLPEIAHRLGASGVAVPAPVFCGGPTPDYPWPWSIVPWFEGTPGLRIERAHRTRWARPLAAALLALHTPAPPDHPVNAYRGVRLSERADDVADRLVHLRRIGDIPPDRLAALQATWADGLAATPWSQEPLWIHGDLHPGNLVAQGDTLVALIDFGDITAGDPAYDLAVAWLAFDAAGREDFRSAMGMCHDAGRYDADVWVRARAWAAAVTLMLLTHSDDNPEYEALGSECLDELAPGGQRASARSDGSGGS